MPDSKAIIRIRKETREQLAEKLLDLLSDPKITIELLTPKDYAELLRNLSRAIALLQRAKMI